jgi:YVTN family beta-propeller protein/VCBS repeat-containing protein
VGALDVAGPESISSSSSSATGRVPQQRVVAAEAVPQSGAGVAQGAPKSLGAPVTPASVLSSVVSGVLGLVGLGSVAGSGPAVPADSPLLWTMLAGVRNRWGQVPTADALQAKSASPSTSQDTSDGVPPAAFTEFAAAAVNTPPSASPTQGTPNQLTGMISGTVNGVDQEGNTLSYAVSGAPASGSVTLNSSTGAFAYTPTQAARLAAGTTAAADFDSFTVNVSDGQAVTPVAVSVAVLPSVISGPTSSAQTGVNPLGVAVTGSKTYVANAASNTVSVFDRANSAAAPATINVVSGPQALALGPDGRLWVAGNNGVSVINTATNQVTSTVTTGVGQSYGVAVGVLPNGQQRVYVTGTGNNRVAVVDASAVTPSVLTSVAVGWTPAGAAVSPDGTRLYVANFSSNNVSVIDTSTNTVARTYAVGANPYGVAVSPDSTRVFVSNAGANSVSVINTATAAVSSVAVGANPFGIALSPDGGLLYVANGPDTVSVVNTKSSTVMSTVTIDAQAENQWHAVAVSPDGRQIYVSDLADRTVRILTINRGNTAPIAGNLSAGTPDVNSGAVSGALNFLDTDGDALSYSVTQPSTGTVSTTAAGGYTFTPSQAARDAAAAGGPTSTSFTVAASDGQSTALVVATNVPILPTPQVNRPPTAGTPGVGTPDRVTGTVTGALNFTDPEHNPLTYTVPGQPSAGTVTVLNTGPNAGTYSFTPNQPARDAAANGGPTSTTISVLASDGQASTVVTFSVPIKETNRAPSAGTPSMGTPNAATGTVTGTLNFTDPEGDALTYNVPTQPPTGTVTVTAAGGFAFTPTQSARDAAAHGGPTSATVTATASDGLATGTVTFSVPISPTPPVNQAPTANPIQQAPNQQTGAINGLINGADPEGGPLTYTVTGTPPANGSVNLDTTTGAFTYTPTQAARLAAQSTPTADFDSFAANVNDGQNTTAVTVKVAILPALVSPVTSKQVGANPMGVAVAPTKTYVANQVSNTVSVIDRANPNATPVTINVVGSPTAITLSADGSRAYAAGNNAISVINTATNTVIATVITNGGQSYGIATTPGSAGVQRLYVSNTGNNTVSVITANTATNSYTLTGTVTGVGATPAGVAVSSDGSRAYVANWNSGNVSVINTATNAVIRTIAVGANPFGVAVSADGTRVYVSNYGSNTVSVLNPTASTALVTSIAVGTNPFGLAISQDGSLLYAANGPDTVSIISAKSNAVVQSVTIDTAPESQWHQIGLSPDGGQVYVSDLADGQVRTFTFTRGNTPPTAGTPTVGAPNPVTGIVQGSLNITDTDGDALSYSMQGQPPSGTVVVDAVGNFTYTPTPAARDAAAQTQGPDFASFTVTVTDGLISSPISVTVNNIPIAPTAPVPVTVTTIGVSGNPSTVAINGNRAYVGTNTGMSIIDTNTNTVIGNAALLYGGGSSAVTPDGKFRYAGSGESVLVVNTATGQTAQTIGIPHCNDCAYGNTAGVAELVMNPQGTRVYAREDYYTENGGVSVISEIDTSTNTIVSTGYSTLVSGLTVTPDGSRIYVGEAFYPQVDVFDAATLDGIATIMARPSNDSYAYIGPVAVSADGKYVVADVYPFSSGRPIEHAIIDADPTSATYNTRLATLVVQNSALSPDGARRYVTQPDGKTVLIYDTATNLVIGTFTTDQTSGASIRSIAFAPNGTVYITDSADNAVYAVTVGNPAQQM